ncbi:MAG: HNH endonuclease signature motif containing protein [Dermatophilaceae bacterium]
MEQDSPSILRESILRESSAGVGERIYGILDTVRGAVDVCSVAAGDRGVDEWMTVLGEVSQALTVLAAARDAAIVRLAAIDETVTEDGVVGEQVNGLGTVCLDAGAMVSTATGTSARFGENLVEQAVTRVVRVPALHEAMLEGMLDDYKARRLAGELSDVPPDLARAVVDALAGDLAAKSGPALQRRARAILMSLCPDLLRERIRKARKGVGLRRWMGEPGTDAWGGSFPSERAARAWAAIDALARRYRSEGRHDTLEKARAYALMDLVDGNATVETVLHLTVPAEGLDEATRAVAEDTDGDHPRGADTAGGNAPDADADTGGGNACDADTGEGPSADVGEDVEDGAGELARSVVTGQAQATAGDRGHVAGSGGAVFFPPQPGDAPGQHTASSEVFVAVAGAQGQSLSWFPVAALPRCSREVAPAETVCHSWTGALLDVGDALATRAYRPGERLKSLVRRRDGGCRFPGCSVSARQCDLDHVVPWPHGPTAASNLICLCRRHHRVKQRHRWRVSLGADGAVEWIDPTGRLHRSEPVDHLGTTQVRVLDTRSGIVAGHQSDGDDDDGDLAACDDLGSSVLEQWLEVMVEHTAGGSTMRSSTPRVQPATDGRRGRCPTALSGEEIDELSRAVRAGRFAGIEDAVSAMQAEATEQAAARQQQSRRGCRVDHHVPPRDRTLTIKIKIKRKTLPSHRDRRAPTPPTPSPPPF